MKIDRIQLEIAIKHDKARQEIADITQRLQGETKQLNELNKAKKKAMKRFKDENHPEVVKTTQAYETQAKRIRDLEARKDDLRRSLKVEGLSIAEVRDELKKYNMQLANLTPGTEKFNETKQHVEELKARLKELTSNANGAKDSLMKFADDANKIGFAITNVLAIKDRIVQWADQYVQSFAKMDEAMTDVTKYTGQTKAEVEAMNETFKRMETRTAREELNALAGAAGRLGITARKDIEGFVSAADKINVALGDDLGEGAIDQIGKLTMVFGEDKKKGLEGAMLATGSAINVLGASSSANTGFITEFTSRMAGMAVNARISQTDIMGYASALSQAGIEGETASGVFAQMITKMFTDPAKFAKAAGLEVKAFTDLLKTDANQAILQFLEGLKSKGGFDSLAPALKSLGLQGTQSIPVISSLINKMSELKQAQQTAATAYEQGTSIIDEFNNANSSAAAKLEIAKKGLNDVTVELGQKLMPIVEGGLTTSKVVLQILSEVAGFVTRNIATLSRLAIGVGAYTAAVQIATSATKIWAAVTKATPWGLVLGGIAAALVAYDKYKTRLAETRKLQEELNKVDADATTKYAEQSREVKRLDAALRDERVSIDERRKALDRLKAIIPEYNGMLDEEGRLTRDNKKAIDNYLVSLQKQIRLKAYQDKLEELYARQATQEEEQRTASDKYWNTRQTNTLQGGNSPVMSLMRRLGIGEEASLKRALDAADKSLADTNGKITALENRIKDLGGSVISTTESTPQSPGVTPEPAGNGSGSGKSDSELKKEQTERDRRRRELEAQAKAAWEREKIRLRQQYQGKKQLQDEWHQKEFEAEQQYIDRLAQIRTSHGASEADRMEVANMQLDAITREANRRQEAEKRRLAERLQQIDLEQGADEIALARQRLDGEVATQKEYNERKAQLEIDYQRRRVALLKVGTAEYQQAMRQLLQMEQTQADTRQADSKQGKQRYQQGMNTFLHDLFADTSSFDEMRRLNEEFYEQGRISYQQYQQNLSDIAQQETDRRKQMEQAAMDATQQLLQSSGQLFSALQSRETAEVDAKYKRMIAAAKKQGRDTTKLEEQQEAEKAAISKKYAQKQFQMNVLQIIASTATGIARLWKDLPFYAALPLTAVVAASGAMQLASAKAAADQAAGLYGGGYSDDYQQGYTKKGNPRERAGVIPVHKNEFVANHRAVANPEVRPVLDVIDAHQRRGDIQILNATRLLDEAYGRYRGGYTAPPSAPAQGAGPGAGAADQQQLTDLLERIARNTANSLTVRRLRDEISHEERLERNARR